MRKFLAVLLVLCLALSVGAQAEATPSFTVDGDVTLNEDSGALAVRGDDTGHYVLMTADGTALTDTAYIHMDPLEAAFEVAAESGVNVLGVMDSQGTLLVPMQYGDVEYLSDRWQVGITLVDATAEHYDYKSFSGDYYLVGGYDVYYRGQLVGTLSRLEYRYAYAYGNYLYVYDEEGNYTYFDSAMTPSVYAGEYPSSSEYEDVYKKGVFHRGSGQQAFVAGCTLTADDVYMDVYVMDDQVLDLQGNVLADLRGKYESVYDFDGDYVKVRSNGLYGLVDRTGREVLACEYDEITSGDETYFEGGYQIAIKDGKVGYVNAGGQVTCDFKYGENVVDSTYKMPMTSLTDLEGNVIVLSGAAGELPQRFVEVDISYHYGCPLFAGVEAEDKAGVYDMYGNVVIPADGSYNDVYDFQIAADGSVVVGYNQDRTYTVYQVNATAADAPAGGAGLGAALDAGAGDAPEAADDNSWTCTCGSVNSGNFCPECGASCPEEKLACQNCGFEPAEGEAPKFCSECGTAF